MKVSSKQTSRVAGVRTVFVLAAALAAAAPSTALQGFEAPIPLTSPFACSNSCQLIPAVLDANGDGLADLVSAADDEVFYLPAVQEAQFDLGRKLTLNFAAGDRIRAVGAHDVDGDGDLDLFVRTSGTNRSLYVFEAVAGTGIQSQPVEIHDLPGVTPFEQRLNFRDLDGDGIADIHSSNTTSGKPEWVAFRRGSSYQVEIFDLASTGTYVAFADLNGDGLDDLIAGSLSVVIYRQQSSPGVFGPPVPLDVGAGFPYVSQVLFADLDDDGDQDVILRGGVPKVRALENTDGAGTLALRGALYAGSNDPSDSFGHLYLVDADRDGDEDLVAASCSVGNVPARWWERRGDFDYAPAVTIPTGGSFQQRWMSVQDISGDGLPDLLFLLERDSAVFVSVSEEAPPGQLFLREQYQSVSGPSPGNDISGIVPFDFDVDGDLDLAYSHYTGVWISRNVGPGRFDAPFLFEDAVGSVTGISAGDVDGDGDDDLVLNRPTRTVLLENEGGESFRKQTLQSGIPTGFPGPILVDFDGDGDLDVMGHRESGRILYLVEQSPTGASSFLPPRNIITSNRTLESAVLVDMDQDGDLDLAMGQSRQSIDSPRILVCERTAPYGFGPPRIIASQGLRAESVSAIDVTGDGVVEVVWVETAGGRVRASSLTPQGLLGAPFTAATFAGEGLSIVNLPSPSMNGRDLVVGSSGPNGAGPVELQYLRWSATSGYAAPVMIDGPIEGASMLEAADFDLDGDADLVVGRRPFWLPGRRVLSFGDPGCSAAVPNSTGRIGQMAAIGSTEVAAGNVTLIGTDMPGNSLVTYLCSLAPGEVLTAGGGLGTLCLSGEIGRFLGAGQAGFTNADGRRDVEVDLAAFPQPTGSVPVLAGQRWYFQGWHRDAVGGSAVSNFTASASILFQ